MLYKYLQPFIPVFILFLALCPFRADATHIVGGEMTYRCLGNDEYEISLTIFRDCYNGNPLAFFDDPAKIGIYNSLGTLIDSLLIPFDPILNDTLDPVLSDPCLVVPPDVCVHTTRYAAVKTLPPLFGGYNLIYQRCCRNVTINNIIDPLDTGATFGVNISERALNECNSSALFNQWPPIYICVNQPINFDQSATDEDGDSIVYKLCTPLDGATPSTPEPFPFEQTIPQEVVWVDPPYNLDNVLGGVPLAINENTGFLTGTPNTVGQFVVGICLEEYRDGELISTTRRDFQYNVGECGVALSSFFAPEIICEGLTVTFNNQSENAELFEWYFNDPANPDSVSTATNPTYTFSDTGTYNIVLIAEPGGSCVDTFEQEINLQLPSLFADFEYSYANCTDSLTIDVSDLSFDTISDVIAWEWTLLEGNETLAVSDVQNPTFTVTTSATVTLNLVLTAANGCTQELSQTFPANVFGEETFPDEIIVCSDAEVPLNPDPLPGVTYSWSPSEGLDDPDSPNPIATPDTTTTYIVFIDNLGQCELFDTITVIVDSIAADFVVDVPCDFEVFFTNQSFNATGYDWFFNDPGNPGASSMMTDPSFVYSDTGTFTAMLIANNGAYCLDTAFQEFFIDDPVLFPAFDFEVVNCTDSFTLELNDLSTHSGGLNFEWEWSLSENGQILDSAFIQNPSFDILSDGIYTIELTITDEDSCSSTISEIIPVQIFIPGLIPDENLICANDSVLLNPDPALGMYTWTPGESLSDSTSSSPLAFPGADETYFVTIEDAYGCTFQDTVQVFNDNSFQPPLEGYVESDTIYLGDTTQIFTTVDPGYTYIWAFSNSLSDLGIADPFAFPLETSTYSLEVIDENGCTNSIQFQIVVLERTCDEPEIFLPNAFTPNGDGENDVLRLMGNNIDEMYLVIYNRWGQKIFETTEQAVGWDGTFKGEELPPDAYGYYLRVLCENEERFVKKGNITLLR